MSLPHILYTKLLQAAPEGTLMSLMCTGLCLHPGHPDGQKCLWAESTTARLLYSNAAQGGKGQGDVFIGCNWKLHGKRIVGSNKCFRYLNHQGINL